MELPGREGPLELAKQAVTVEIRRRDLEGEAVERSSSRNGELFSTSQQASQAGQGWQAVRRSILASPRCAGVLM